MKIKPTAFLLSLLALATAGCFKERHLGNVLRVVLIERYKSIDPAHGNEHYSNILIRRAYEGLLEYHYLKRPYELEPLLAEAMPVVSKQGLVYTFKIKKGVHFQDDKAFAATQGHGRELVAEDFIYSFKRVADPEVVSEGWWIFDGRIAGLNAWREAAARTGKADYAAAVEGLKAIDPYTLQITLVKPDPLVIHAFSMPYANVVAREVVEYYGKEFGTHPVGTGPFRLESLGQHQIVWVKNPTFHGQSYPSEGTAEDQQAGRLADAGKPLPFVDKIVDDILVEQQPQWLNFIQGNHDYLQKIPQDNTAMVWNSEHQPQKELRDKGIQVFATPGIWFNYFPFNMEDPVVGGPKNRFLRQAMSLAYDETPSISMFYFGLATKAESPVPPGIIGYDPSFKNPMRQYNLAKAREILAKAGHPNGQGIPALTLDIRSDTAARQVGEYFQRQMAALGLKINLNPLSWPLLLERTRKKQMQLTSISWLYDYPDPQNGWQLLYSKNESPGPNEANYKNLKFDDLYVKMSFMKDGPARRAILKKLGGIFAEDVPWIITVFQAETRLAHPWVHNFKIHSFEHNIDKYLRVDTELRDKRLDEGSSRNASPAGVSRS